LYASATCAAEGTGVFLELARVHVCNEVR
jgi:hypothetical protein